MVERPDGVWTEPNMDRMMDSPIELSAFTLEEWTTGGRQFRMALHHRGTAEEAAAFARMCQAVVAEEEGVFGAFPVYDSGSLHLPARLSALRQRTTAWSTAIPPAFPAPATCAMPPAS